MIQDALLKNCAVEAGACRPIPAIRSELVNYVCQQHDANLRPACCAVGISDSVYLYQRDTQSNDKVIAKLW